MKKFRLILLTIISILSLTLYANTADSLIKQLESGNNRQRLTILEKLAYDRTVPANERIEYSQRAINLAQKLKLLKSEAFAKLSLGRAYNDVRDYLKAVSSLQNAIVIYVEIDDKEGEAKGLSALGGTFFYLKNTEESMKCFEEALSIRIELGDESNISKSMMNLGSINGIIGNFEEAMDYFKKALAIETKNNNLTICSQCYNNIANIHLALGEMDKVLPYRLKALEIDRKLKNKLQIAIKTYNLAEYFLIINDAEKAYPYIIESKELAEELNDEELVNDNIEFLSWYYKLTNNYPKALEYLEQYAKSNKEIFSKELSEKVSEMHVLYETEKNEREKQSIQLQLEKTKKNQNLLRFAFIMIIVVCSFLIYLYYKKRKYNRLLKEEVLIQTNDLQIKNNDLLVSSNLLIKAKEKAEESDQLKSAFLANMSHEIRTPMNSILGFAELLKEPSLNGDEQQQYINKIEKGGERMLNIINDIISISIIDSGQLEVKLTESNINEQIEYIYTFFKPVTESKGLKFSFKNSLLLEEVILKTDRDKVSDILTSLVKNAIKYTDHGSIELGYVIKKDTEPIEVEFYVKDTGIGIPQDRQEAIFERFIQADIVDKMARQGTGLGLAISKAYVEMLGGKIWVESKQGSGSTFYFTLPYNIETKDEFADNEISHPVEKSSINNLKILIAEDEESSEEYIKIVVQKLGKEIISVKTGTEAVEACRNNPDIDLVLMDIKMPEMNGYEATKRIREFNKKVIIIAQTAYALQGDREKAIEAGCNDYLAKPINKGLLHEIIEQHFPNGGK